MESIILSASRMTDMPKFYPQELIKEVQARIDGGVTIHTLVLWTKHPRSLLEEPMKSFLKKIVTDGIQIYLQLTITGMGGRKMGFAIDGSEVIMEPHVPDFEDSLNTIPDLITLVGAPRRIRVRIDPIIYYKDSEGTHWTNEEMIEPIIHACSKHGIPTFSFSFVGDGNHKKVERRFSKLGLSLIIPDDFKRKVFAEAIQRIVTKYNVKIYACATPGFEKSSCINGTLLSTLHNQNLHASEKIGGKRPLCGCSVSTDIGGWPPKICYSGCQYCYSRPAYD